uniref:Uncharacterized protein n=1 Tax=Marseillevirus LCMAC102 TaxID=2506603 RepID=A0A481YT04_9VIRU|nr:MAG: uncharacterized protein LCMAC102_01530 [Marseillevirus LCMAC102]
MSDSQEWLPKRKKLLVTRAQIVEDDSASSDTTSEELSSLPIPTLQEISAPLDADWDKIWISATETRNYLLKDPLIDWLKYNYSQLTTKNSITGRRNSNSFIEYIMEQGTIFETHIIRLLSEKLGNDMVYSIGGELNPRSSTKVTETLDAMNRGIPIIHSGLLHNPETQTYGIPDLLVRSDWINNLVEIPVIDDKKIHKTAPKLRDVHNPENSPHYHYLVVDVKFSTLYLRADGIHILTCGSFPAYKSQLYIYNEALARIQGYNPQKAFVLGRKWRFTSKGEKFKGQNCFDRLGTIDYATVDKEYVTKTHDALKWLRDVKTEEARGWNICNVPLSRPELYPNMCNTHDYPWRNTKEKIADNIKDLTSLWMVGIKQREIAHSRDIYQWTDKKCTPTIMGIKGKFTSRVLGEILEINRSQGNEKVKPQYIKNNFRDWQTQKELEFYVDFETINDVITEFEALPVVKNTSLIFIIGVGFINPLTKKWIFRDFTAHTLTFEEEGRICQEFSDYIRLEAETYDVKNPLCVHWAPAENSFWNDAAKRHSETSEAWKTDEWEWFDLLKVFKEEPIVIKGCLGFSLKKVAGALQKHGCINTSWDMESACLDGQAAMVCAWKAHKESQARNLNMRELPHMREIIKYNEADVKVLYEIITYIRTNHTKNGIEEIPQEPVQTLHCPCCNQSLILENGVLEERSSQKRTFSDFEDSDKDQPQENRHVRKRLKRFKN